MRSPQAQEQAAGSPAGLVTYTNFKTIITGVTPQDVAMILRGGELPSSPRP